MENRNGYNMIMKKITRCFASKSMLLTALALIFLTMGCSPSSKDGQIELLKIDSIEATTVLDLDPNFHKSKMDVHIKYLYPTNNDSILLTMNRYFWGDTLPDNSPMEEKLKRYLEDQKQMFSFEPENPDSDKMYNALTQQKLEMCNEVVYQDTSIFTTRIETDLYTGGIHGSYTVKFLTFDRATNRPLTERDLFVDGYQEQLSKIIKDAIFKLYKVNSPEALEGLGFFSATEIDPNDNFYITPQGLWYCYNEYEIATYALGYIIVRLDFDALEPILAPNSIIRKYI